MQPHYLATFSDPRFSKVYFSKKTEIVNVREAVIDMAKTESLMMETTSSPRPYEANKSVEKDAFWGSFDKDDSISHANGTQSIDSEIALWSVSPNGIGYPEITRRTSGISVYLQGSNL